MMPSHTTFRIHQKLNKYIKLGEHKYSENNLGF